MGSMLPMSKSDKKMALGRTFSVLLWVCSGLARITGMGGLWANSQCGCEMGRAFLSLRDRELH